VIISAGVHLTTVKFSATFDDIVQCHSIITKHMYQLAIYFDAVKRVSPTRIESHYRPLHRAQFPVLLPLHSNLLYEQQLNDWLAQEPPLTNTKATGNKTALIQHASLLPSFTEPDEVKWMRCVDQKGYRYYKQCLT
jgi:hypothetical protein